MQNNHQSKRRLFAFSKFLTFSFGGFFALILLSTVVLGGYWYLNKDYFVEFVPSDSLLYLRINIPLWQDANELDSLNLENLYQSIDKKLDISFKNEILPQIDRQFALSFISLPEQKIGTLLFLKLDKKVIVSKYPGSRIIENKILVLADSQETMQKAEEVWAGREPSLLENIKNDFFEDDFLKVYLNLKKLMEPEPENEGLYNKILISKLINQGIDGVILKANASFGHWSFKAEALPDVKTNLYSSKLKKLKGIEFLPRNFIVFIKGLDLEQTVTDIEKLDKKITDSFQQSLEVIAKQQNLSITADLLSLTSSGFDLLIVQENDTEEQLDFVISFSPQNYGSDNLSNFIPLFENILTQRYAFEEDRVLPDKTGVIEFVLKPDYFKLQQEMYEQYTVYYIIRDELSLELAFIFKDDEIILSTSRALLKNILSSQSKDLAEVEFYNKQCWPTGKSRLVIFNKKEIWQNLHYDWTGLLKFLPGDTYILSQDRDFSFSGCVF